MKRTMDYTEHRSYRFANCTTMETLGTGMSTCYDSMMRMGNKVIFAARTYKGETLASIYEFAEASDAAKCNSIECPLNLIEVAEETFEDTGHAAAWALSRI